MSKQRIDTKDPEALSRPERHVDRKQKRGIAELVEAAGGCFYCLRRDPRTEGWGRALCGKVVPAGATRVEFQKKGCTFEPDAERFAEKGIKL